MISSPHLVTMILYDMLQRRSLYLHMCVAALESKALEYPGVNSSFSLEAILVGLEGCTM